jgi:DNA-directed RNA polymerase specialized sigma subunit
MTAKEYLRQVRWIDQRIDSKIALTERLRDTATKATFTMSDMPRSDSPNLQRMESVIVKIIDMECSINEDIDRLVDLKHTVIAAIRALRNPEQELLMEQHYLNYRSWEDIATMMNYSTRQVLRLHGEALQKIQLPPVDSRNP